MIITRVFFIGFIIFALITAFIYGYKQITKEDFKHAGKITFAGCLTFIIIVSLTLLESS